MNIKINLTNQLPSAADAYVLGYSDNGVCATPLLEEVEKKLDISLVEYGRKEKGFLEKKKGITEVQFFSKKRNVRLFFIPVQADYREMQIQLTEGIHKIMDHFESVVIDGLALGTATELEETEQVFRIVEATNLALYRFDEYKSVKKGMTLKNITIYGYKSNAAERAKERAQIVSRAVKNARNFVNAPAMDINPKSFVEKAKNIAKTHPSLTLEILDVKEMKKKRMNALLAVGKGSEIPPVCLVLTYKGNPKSSKIAGWIGKGVTFDSGGLDLKPADGMLTMKCDMAGAATVLFATEAIAEMNVPINLVTVIPCVENMPSGSAYKPGDILKAMNGKTIEVGNTDAEGRLILADALVLAAERGVTHFIDIATLTGACVVALGEVATGLCSNDTAFAYELMEIGGKENEKIWQMPLFDEYKALIESDVADIVNTGGRWAGMITAAMFLKEFVPENASWCHLDIAGTAFRSKPLGITPKGATGEMVRTLIQWADQTSK